jgi:ABC-2 type transport system ATP-binding protein
MPTALSARLRGAMPRLTRRRAVAGSVVLAVLAALALWAAWPQPPSYRTEERWITVPGGPGEDEAIALDSTLYLPTAASAAHPVPAVLLAHGFGGSKLSVTADAEELAGRGYAVLAWTARGFGASGGRIHLDSPDHEVRDAQRLLDWLAARPEIRTDGVGDPRVGVVGGSYGGGLALLLAGHDRRVDAIIPMIAWHDLARSFLPESTGRAPVDGVFKREWAGLFFGRATGGPGAQTGLSGDPVPPGAVPGVGPGGPRTDPACGRFAREVCEAYLSIATTGRATDDAVALLRRSSPATVLDRITAPTLLIQGEADSLFPLSEADANARGIAAGGTPVRVAWFTGGHDGGAGPQTDQDRLRFLTAQWLGHYLKGEGEAPPTSFTWSRIAGYDALDRGLVTNGYSTGAYPGLGGVASRSVAVAGPVQPIANPPNGTPAAISSVPFAGSLASFVNGVVTDVPGQHARFQSRPLERTIEVEGAPNVSIRAASPTGEAVLFVKLYDVGPDGRASLPSGLIAPVRLSGLPADISRARPVTVTLPAIVHRFEAGHSLRITVATSDQAYATPIRPTVYAVGLGPGETAAVTMPTVGGDPIPSRDAVWRWVLAALLATIAAGLVVVVAVARRRHRRTSRTVAEGYAETPLVVRGLRKEYDDGFVAVSRVDFSVQRGQVVGLLGPNGAGKTTTLRVLMGLTRPTAGDVLVFGHRLSPGAPVLSRLGALVEGPGFLPHLSGLENLRSYWKATGRPEADARFDDALDIAGLGAAIHRKVRTYSHGMKQRLAIAQAMLGLPELLVLDEPTDGLDPPQIAEMRRVLKRYATGGRAVLVSSHLLAEVEQTCTHVVVVHKGEVVASGPVEEIVGDSPSVTLDVSDVPAAEAVLARLSGIRSVSPDGASSLVVDVNGTARSQVVAALVRAGVGVNRIVPRRRLEDAFLALVGENTRGGGDR